MEQHAVAAAAKRTCFIRRHDAQFLAAGAVAMTDYSDFKAQIAEYANRQDWSDALVTGFVRQSEQKLNSELRVDRMIKTSQNLVNCRCSTLPDDWLQMDLGKIENANGADGFLPSRYKA